MKLVLRVPLERILIKKKIKFEIKIFIDEGKWKFFSTRKATFNYLQVSKMKINNIKKIRETVQLHKTSRKFVEMTEKKSKHIQHSSFPIEIFSLKKVSISFR